MDWADSIFALRVSRREYEYRAWLRRREYEYKAWLRISLILLYVLDIWYSI